MNTNITKAGCISFIQMISFAAFMQASSLPENGPERNITTELTFAENKCQVKSTAKANKKILYSAQAEHVKYLFRKDGISMILKQVNNDKNVDANRASEHVTEDVNKLDISWEGMNKDADVYGAEVISNKMNKSFQQDNAKECENKKFRKLYYTEIYPGIDLRYYNQDNLLKYDLNVHPGFDYKNIKMKMDGDVDLSLNANGQLIMRTPSGYIIQNAPIVLQDGKPLMASWTIQDNTVSIDIKNQDLQKELNIQAIIALKGFEDYKM